MSTYLTWLADELRAVGCNVVEQDGWQTRARSSGGFADGKPWCVMWHHTASPAGTSAKADADYMSYGSDSRPIANLMIARDGSVWVLAAGATNTNGKGLATPFSRGTVPADSMNTHAVGVEICNDGLGEPYSEQQIDAAFLASIAVAERLGLDPGDVCNHHSYAPDRKIDPAKAASVQGPWRPRGETSSDIWLLEDLKAEHGRRWGLTTPVPPIDPGGDDMPDKETFQQWMREVLNEGTATGQTGWAGTSKETLGIGQANYNEIKVVQGMVAGLSESDARASVEAELVASETTEQETPP